MLLCWVCKKTTIAHTLAITTFSFPEGLINAINSDLKAGILNETYVSREDKAEKEEPMM